MVASRSPGHHIGCAWANGRGAGKRLETASGFRIGRRDMHHRLLVARLVIAEFGHLLQGLANSRDIAMAKDTKASGEKGLFLPSRSTYWFFRKAMMACAIVTRFVACSFISFLPLSRA